MKVLTIPLLALLLTTAASGQLFNITLNGRVDTIENNTGLTLDDSVYPGSPMTVNVSGNRDELQLETFYSNPEGTYVSKRWEGAKLSVSIGNYGLSAVDTLLEYNLRETDPSVNFLSVGGPGGRVERADLLGSLFEKASEYPLASDPHVREIYGVNLMNTSAFAGGVEKLNEFENLLFNDPSFLETFEGIFDVVLFGENFYDSIYLAFNASTDERDSPSGTALPEPSTYGLFGALGLFALIGHRRFRPFKKSL